MRDAHLTREVLRHLLEQDNDEEQNRLLLHHLAVCPACYRVGGHILDLYLAGAVDLHFCTVDLALAASRTEAPALLAKLERFSPPRQRALVRHAKRFRSWGLVELLCSESLAAAPRDPSLALHYGELATLLASTLKEWEPVELDWLRQLRGYAWAHLGNARRVIGELRSADEAFETAEQHWEAGFVSCGDTFGYGWCLLALKASLRRTQGRHAEALALLAAALQSEAGRQHAATILVNKARTFEEAGDLDGAIAALREAEPQVDREADPRLYLCVRHNLVDALSRTGRYDDAASLLPEVERLAAQGRDDLDRVRAAWLAGRIAAGLGEVGRGIAILRDVQTALLDRGLGYDTALVSLELATLLAGVGDAGAVKALARAILPVLSAADVHREALAALALFEQAAERDEASAAFSSRLVAYLHQARENPTLRFVP